MQQSSESEASLNVHAFSTHTSDDDIACFVLLGKKVDFLLSFPINVPLPVSWTSRSCIYIPSSTHEPLSFFSEEGSRLVPFTLDLKLRCSIETILIFKGNT